MNKWKQKIALLLAMVLVLGQSPMVYLAQATEGNSGVVMVEDTTGDTTGDTTTDVTYSLTVSHVADSGTAPTRPENQNVAVTVTIVTEDDSTETSTATVKTVPSDLDDTDTHTFDGWYTDSSCTKPLAVGDELTKSDTIYAKWTEKSVEPETTKTTVTLTLNFRYMDDVTWNSTKFDDGKATSLDLEVEYTGQIKEGDIGLALYNTLTAENKPTKNSSGGYEYTFNEWFCEVMDEFTTEKATVSIFIMWDEEKFPTHKDQSAFIKFEGMENVTGWSPPSSFGTQASDGSYEVTVNLPMDDKGETDFNDYVDAVEKLLEETPLSNITVDDEEYTFSSWSLRMESYLYFKANWEKVSGDTMNLTLNVEHVTTDDSEITHSTKTQAFTVVKSGTTTVTYAISALPTLTSDTHSFNGWYTDKDLKTKLAVGDKVTSGQEIYASWTEGATAEYTIKFHANGGVLDASTEDMTTNTDGKLASLPTAPKHSNPDYTFDAWYTAATAGTQVTTSHVFTADATVYAQWDDGIEGITVYEKPDKLTYNAGDKIDPTGLEIKITYDNGEYEYVSYDEDTEDDFSFSPGLSTVLTGSHTSLTVDYLGHTASFAIVVLDSSVGIVVTVEDYEGDEVTDAKVILTQGSSTKYTATDNDDGTYTFTSVEEGDYNLIVTYGDHVRTFWVEADDDLEIDVELSEFAIATTVESDLDFEVLTVDGLDDLALSLEGDEGEIVTVNMNFDTYVSSTEKDMIMLHKPNDEIIAQIFDVSLSKIVGYEDSNELDTTALTELSMLVSFTFEVEEDYQDRSSYSVYRKHGDVVEELTTSKNSSGEYISVDKTNHTVTVHSKNFSTYALVVEAEEGEEDDDYVSSLQAVAIIKTLNHEEITTDVPGTVEANNMFPKYGDKVYLTVTETTGYTMVGITAVDNQGNNIAVLDGGMTGSYYFTQLQYPVEVTVKYLGNTPSTAPSTYTGFLDVSNTAYYYFYVYRCHELGLMEGTGNGLFQPEKVTTRAEVATILYKMAGSQAFYAENIFSDIQEGEWYYNPVLWAKSVGVISGYTDGTFRPDESVTREEIAVMFYQFAKYKGVNVTTGYVAQYNDFDTIATWAQSAVNWCTHRGLFTGFDGNIYVPSATSRRCDVSVSLVNLHGLL